MDDKRSMTVVRRMFTDPALKRINLIPSIETKLRDEKKKLEDMPEGIHPHRFTLYSLKEDDKDAFDLFLKQWPGSEAHAAAVAYCNETRDARAEAAKKRGRDPLRLLTGDSRSDESVMWDAVHDAFRQSPWIQNKKTQGEKYHQQERLIGKMEDSIEKAVKVKACLEEVCVIGPLPTDGLPVKVEERKGSRFYGVLVPVDGRLLRLTCRNKGDAEGVVSDVWTLLDGTREIAAVELSSGAVCARELGVSAQLAASLAVAREKGWSEALAEWGRAFRTCTRCGKTLTTASSRARGVGDECARHATPT